MQIIHHISQTCSPQTASRNLTNTREDAVDGVLKEAHCERIVTYFRSRSDFTAIVWHIKVMGLKNCVKIMEFLTPC